MRVFLGLFWFAYWLVAFLGFRDSSAQTSPECNDGMEFRIVGLTLNPKAAVVLGGFWVTRFKVSGF